MVLGFPNVEERELSESVVSAAVYNRVMELQVSSFKIDNFHMRGTLLLLPWILVHSQCTLLLSLCPKISKTIQKSI